MIRRGQRCQWQELDWSKTLRAVEVQVAAPPPACDILLAMKKEGNSVREQPVPTSERLLAAAATLFRRQGYATTTTRQLASLLGIRNATLYHHIAKKEDLLYALCVDSLERIHQEVERAIAGQEDPLQRLRAMIHTHIITGLADRDKHATVLLESRALSDPRRAKVRSLRDAYIAVLQQNVSAAQAAGVIRADVEPEYLVLGLLSMVNWSIFWFSSTWKKLDGEQLADLLATLFMQGATVRPSAPLEGQDAQPGTGR